MKLRVHHLSLFLLLDGCLVLDTIRAKTTATPPEQTPEEMMMMMNSAGDFKVGGTVSGYWGTGLVLTLGSETLPITMNGAYQFASTVSTYAVTVTTQPSDPPQTCVAQNASGTATADVGNVDITCTSIKDYPRVLFSDITHGPKSGGENDAGAFVTLYGLGFGATQSSVTIGGAPAVIKRWGDPAPRGLETIIVQAGPGTPSGMQPIVVTVNGIASKPLTYDVRVSGNVLIKASTDNIQTVVTAATAGDVIYLHAGSYTDKIGDPPYGSWLYINQTKDVAIVAYPGEDAVVVAATPDGTYTTPVPINFNANPINIDQTNTTIAKLRFTGDPKWAIYGQGRLRVVGNTFQIGSPSNVCYTSFGSVLSWENSRGARILGNSFEARCFGFRAEGSSTLEDLELGWNEIKNGSPGFVYITTYNANATLNDVRVHANYMHDETHLSVPQSPLLVSQPDDIVADPAVHHLRIYNNIVRDAHREGLDIGGEGNLSTPTRVEVTIAHNSIYSSDTSGCIGFYDPEGKVDVVNNALLAPSGKCMTFVNDHINSVTQGANLFACGVASTAVPNGTWPMSTTTGMLPFITDDPLAPAQFAPTFLDTGVTLPDISTDFFGRSRRHGGAPDMGAIEGY